EIETAVPVTVIPRLIARVRPRARTLPDGRGSDASAVVENQGRAGCSGRSFVLRYSPQSIFRSSQPPDRPFCGNIVAMRIAVLILGILGGLAAGGIGFFSLREAKQFDTQIREWAR